MNTTSTAAYHTDETSNVFRHVSKKKNTSTPTSQSDYDDATLDHQDTTHILNRTGSGETTETWCITEPSSSFESTDDDDDDYLSITSLTNTPKPSQEEAPNSTEDVECPICLSTIPHSSSTTTLILQNCGHAFCLPCFQHCITAQVHDGNAANIHCPLPMSECGACIHPNDLQHALGDEQYQKLDHYALQAAFASDRTFHHCVTPDCPNVVFTDEDCDGVCCEFACEVCHKSSCLQCKVSPFHHGLTCAQYHKKQTKKQRRSILSIFLKRKKKKLPSLTTTTTTTFKVRTLQNSTKQRRPNRQNNNNNTKSSSLEEAPLEIKPCRNCGAQILKEAGCNKIKCRCGYRFCFICGSENATCGHTADVHGFVDNVTGRTEFPSSERYRRNKVKWLDVLLFPQATYGRRKSVL